MHEQWPWHRKKIDLELKQKRKAHRYGYFAEWLVLLLLMLKGYRLLARRYAVQGGEIDLIMRRGQLVVFIEVKARRDLQSAIHAIDHRKWRKFARTVRVWLQRNPWACEYSLRCDAAYIINGWRMHYIEDAFQFD
ncbi:YraN family protein [Microvirga sp. W0021]|uniref:UPF0102 protein WJT86_02340 n=1 Tax=Hohaiivirga grylli TaxID=3133970 RepID=A0ABV0BG07_9HYPH